MRILITGVAGFLGHRFAQWVIENHHNCDIVGIDDFSGGYQENIPYGVEFYYGDCGEVIACTQPLFSKPFDAVFHFAAYAAETLSPFVRQYNYRNNVVSTMGLLNQVLSGDCGRFVFTSSIAVYGHSIAPFDEGYPCVPNDPYGVAKLAVEQDLQIAGVQHGLDWCVLRPHNIYGPGQSLWQKDRNVFAIWMRQIFQSQPITIFGDGSQKRAFTYIDDILPCLWQAAFAQEANRQIINLGGSKPTTINGAAELLGVKSTHLPERFEVKESWCTTDKSETLLGYQDKTTLVEGIAAMYDWAFEEWKKYPNRTLKGPELELRVH